VIFCTASSKLTISSSTLAFRINLRLATSAAGVSAEVGSAAEFMTTASLLLSLAAISACAVSAGATVAGYALKSRSTFDVVSETAGGAASARSFGFPAANSSDLSKATVGAGANVAALWGGCSDNRSFA
jgi:hypothetical protein